MLTHRIRRLFLVATTAAVLVGGTAGTVTSTATADSKAHKGLKNIKLQERSNFEFRTSF